MWQETPYTIPLLAGASTLVALAVYIWWRHKVAAAKTISLIFLSGSGWVLGYTLELTNTNLSAKVFWYKIELLSIVIISMAWIIFTLQYTGRKWATRRILTLFIIPVLTVFLTFTNEYHGLMWANTIVRAENGLVLLDYIHGAWFWVHAAYSYLLIVIGSFLLIQMFIHSRPLYRWQVITLLITAFFPVVLSILNLVKIYTLTHPRITLFLLPATSVTVAWIIFRFRVADIIPVARGAVMDRMSDGVMVLDSQNRILDVNPAVQHLLGISTAQLIGQPITTVWPAWGNQTELHRQEAILIQKNEQYFDIRISPITDWRGNLLSSVVVLRDITERKKAEENLHESEEKFRTIFEYANDEIVYLDKYGNIIDMNKKSEEIFGYSREEVIGKNFTELELLTLENRAKMIDLFKNVVIEGNPLPAPLIELELNSKDGKKIIAEVSAQLIKKNGEVHSVLAILRDITERKKIEEQIKASLREKEVLLREIHHRVKNNLQIVSSLLRLQSTYIKDLQYADMLKESQHRIKSMVLIHEKLFQSEDLARIDFDRYIKDMIHELLQSYCVNTAITPKIEVGDISLPVDAAIPCGLIINELISNSLKYAFPHGKGEIFVGLNAVNGNYELTVSDNGVGIPDTIDFRNTETLGLHLVTILAEGQLDGEIVLTREKGTTFCITFKK